MNSPQIDDLVRRINLALESISGETLIRARTAAEREQRGAYFLLDWRGNVSGEHVDPRALAEELGVAARRGQPA